MTNQNNDTKPPKQVKQSNGVPSIITKLLEFQKLGITIEKDGTNPHFKSKYATLKEVLEKVKKPLSDLGILILQVPTAEGLKTQLFDTSDNSFIDAFMPYVDATTPQKLGSNNTYNRRYSLVTILALADEDDDGTIASTPTPVRRPAVAPAKPVAVATKTVPVAPVAQSDVESIEDIIG